MRYGLIAIALLAVGCARETVNDPAASAQPASDAAGATTQRIATKPPPDIRKSRWGDSVQAVISAEGTPDRHRGQVLAYRANVGSLSANLYFQFVKGRLNSATYFFVENHSERNLYVRDFESIDQLLRKKYGTPAAENDTWSNDLYRNDPLEIGMAIAAGHLMRVHTWKVGARTNIGHILSGDNYEIEHALQYSDSTAQEEAMEEADAEALKAL